MKGSASVSKYCFMPLARDRQSCLAQSVKETQWVIVEGEGTESTSGVHREGKQYYSEAPTRSNNSAMARWLSHGNHSDNLTPVDQTGLRTDCTQCCPALTDHAYMASRELIISMTLSIAVLVQCLDWEYPLLPLLCVLETQMAYIWVWTA